MTEHLKAIPDADREILRFEMNREGFEIFARVMFPEKGKGRTPVQVQADRDRVIGHFWAGALQMKWSDKKVSQEGNRMKVMDALKRIKSGERVMVSLTKRQGDGRAFHFTDGTEIRREQFEEIKEFLLPEDTGLFDGSEPQSYVWGG